VEFAAQLLALRYANQCPGLLQPGTGEALEAAATAGLLAAETCQQLLHAYRTLRGVEARLRLMNAVARHDLPEDTAQLRRLSYLLRYRLPQELQRDVQATMARTRESLLEVQRTLQLM
jgi:glutamine synthetase adenylyltransferase